MQIKDDINLLAKTIRQLNERWWQDPHTLRPIIRILDIAANLNMDIGGAMEEKLAYNSIRQDHTFEARKAPGGKKF